MPTESDQELMAKISQLAGKINRHKNQQAGFVPPPTAGFGPQRTPASPSRRNDGGVDGLENTGHPSSWRHGGYPVRGHPIARPPVHRHRTLILNGTSQPKKPGDAADSTTTAASPELSQSSWISKTDRHLQLINSSVYEKETQARTRAMEETRRQKQAMRDERERSKLLDFLNHTAPSPANQHASARSYEVTVQGIRFVVAKNGSKLVKAPGDVNSAKATPKMAMVGGVRFHRSKNGNLYRHSILAAQRQTGAVKKVDVPCKMFSMTGNSISPNKHTTPRTTSLRLEFGKSKDRSPLTETQVPAPTARGAAIFMTRSGSPPARTFSSKENAPSGIRVISLMTFAPNAPPLACTLPKVIVRTLTAGILM